MNRLPPPTEASLRRSDWIEGHWLALADGQSWCFPPPSAIPGYDSTAHEMAKAVIDNLLPFMNIEAIKRYGQDVMEGRPEGFLRTMGNVLAIHQVAYLCGAMLLRRNYSVTDDDCESLMPFNYQMDEFFDPTSKVHQATPELLAICNSIARISGVDIGPELARIAASN
jgi:hypothetical protein